MSAHRTDTPLRTLAAPLCALALAACGGTTDRGAPLDLSILHINDHHSHLDAETTALTLKDATGASRSVTVELGGFPRVAAAIEQLAAGKANVLKLHAGDAITGEPALSGFPVKYKLLQLGSDLTLTSLNGSLILLK